VPDTYPRKPVTIRAVTAADDRPEVPGKHTASPTKSDNAVNAVHSSSPCASAGLTTPATPYK